MNRPLSILATPLLAAVWQAAASDGSRGAIQLDGRLDEPIWKGAVLTGQLVQQSPRPSQPTPYQTEFRVLITGNVLYFGFTCADPEPARISVHAMQRDAVLAGDDSLGLVLDTYGDKRTGYYFGINTAAARVDGLISDPEHVSLDWDGIWDARVARIEGGWSAEIAIPARTLNFTPGLKSWGLNIERFVARDRTQLRWASPTLDSYFYDLSRAGALPGVESLSQGRGLEFSPYVVGRMRDIFGRSPRAWQSAAGGEFTWRITPELAAVFTGNTDFAETEVDSRQINITRFPLFFPEKRGFFLEGSNQFSFGLGLGEDFVPFFTRRIGLLGGRQVPIDAGVKLNGRAGKWNVGLIDVQTRATSFAPATNLFAGRVSYDFSKDLRIGTLITRGDPEGGRNNTLAGIDAVWRTSRFRGDKNLLVGAWGAFSAGEGPRGNNRGWGFKVDYPNDLVDCAVTVNEFGDTLRPALGFLPRPGVRRYHPKCDIMPRPSKNGPFGWIRQAFFETSYDRVTNLNGVNESWTFSNSPVNIQLESGDGFEFKWSPQYERLPAPFEIVPGVAVRPGEYHFIRWHLVAETSQHRPLRFGSTTALGDFYSGRLTQWINRVNWTSPRGRLQLGLATEQNFGHLKEGDVVQRLWQWQAAYAWSSNLALTSFVQYDTESMNLGANTRLRWTMRPGRELFLVWNRGWRRLITSRDDLTLISETELLALKLRWTFRQ